MTLKVDQYLLSQKTFRKFQRLLAMFNNPPVPLRVVLKRRPCLAKATAEGVYREGLYAPWAQSIWPTDKSVESLVYTKRRGHVLLQPGGALPHLWEIVADR